MTEYQLVAFFGVAFVKRASDGANIPIDPANRDYAAYLDWLAEGNTPDETPAPLVADDVTFANDPWQGV